MSKTTSPASPDDGMTPAERQAAKDHAREIQGANSRASWPFSMDHIQQGLRHCTPEKKEVLIWCFQWCIQQGLSRDDFATAVDYEPQTIYKIFTGKHKDPRSGERYDIPTKLFKNAKAWRKLQLARAKLGRSEFVITPTVRRIWQGCDLARESQTPVFVYGASHLGKTVGLTEYTLRNNHGRTTLIRIPASAGLGGMVRATATAVGLSPNGNVADLVERIKASVTGDMLLIFDEVHELMFTYRKESFFACMEVIRSIYDHTECGMVLCTTNVFGSRMENERRQNLEQLFRRGVHRIQLGDIVRVEDLKPIFKHNALPWPKPKDQIRIGDIVEQPHDILRQLAKDHGLKAITERIRYARKLATRDAAKVTLDHFVRAHLIIQNNAQTPKDDWK